jgi:hypothetical protein
MNFYDLFSRGMQNASTAQKEKASFARNVVTVMNATLPSKKWKNIH